MCEIVAVIGRPYSGTLLLLAEVVESIDPNPGSLGRVALRASRFNHDGVSAPGEIRNRIHGGLRFRLRGIGIDRALQRSVDVDASNTGPSVAICDPTDGSAGESK